METSHIHKVKCKYCDTELCLDTGWVVKAIMKTKCSGCEETGWYDLTKTDKKIPNECSEEI